MPLCSLNQLLSSISCDMHISYALDVDYTMATNEDLDIASIDHVPTP